MTRALLALLIVFGHLGAQIHAHAVAHEICSSHPGETCHDHGTEGIASLDPHDHERDQDHPSPDSDDAPEHEHCPILPIVVAHGAFVLDAPVVSVTPFLASAPADYLLIGNLLVPPRAPLTYAPKTSPPVSA